ncbi:Uncharacterised protein [Mycolicibacterium vanbaalenii]|uniref:Uncharacterized protein n=1 Tax=Mycolicibacterium vanbaalenii TaxID=110539 RepID=A0A5S9RAJ4_MYCVN|nr:hypothetical protein [Mycolicibacterium vanbaalenii]CAA0136362.1 Uncharacterised protein [Mycolicibacterium vanbaalenii]
MSVLEWLGVLVVLGVVFCCGWVSAVWFLARHPRVVLEALRRAQERAEVARLERLMGEEGRHG